MYKIVSSTSVRKNWSEFIDTVVRKQPQFLKRNRDILTVLSIEHLSLLLDGYKIYLNIKHTENGKYQGELIDFDINTSGNSLSEVSNNIVELLIDFSDQYMSNLEINLKLNNKKNLFPLVLKILLYKFNNQNIKDFLVVNN